MKLGHLQFFQNSTTHQNIRMMFYMTMLIWMPPLRVYHTRICLYCIPKLGHPCSMRVILELRNNSETN